MYTADCTTHWCSFAVSFHKCKACPNGGSSLESATCGASSSKRGQVIHINLYLISLMSAVSFTFHFLSKSLLILWLNGEEAEQYNITTSTFLFV